MTGDEPIRTVAAFDFDGTLTKRDSFVGFLVHLAGWPRVALAVARHGRFVRRRDVLKAKVCATLLRGRSDLHERGSAYAENVLATGLRTDIVQRLDWHRAQGHELAIVSASLDCYLETVAAHLGVAHLLCTTLAYDTDRRATGELVGGNCRGAEKLRRIHTEFGADGYVLWAYGDSAGDNEMLAAATHAVRV